MMKVDSITDIMNTLSYANQFRAKVFLIKIGGSVLNDEGMIQSICNDIKLLNEAGIKVLIVHGGSKAINEHLSMNNITSHFVDGLRVTSKEAMKIIEMVLCGHVNKLLVRKLNSIGLHAIGFSGADNKLLQCQYHSEQHGQVGDIVKVNFEILKSFLQNDLNHFNFIPVIAPVGVDKNGDPLNVNADYAASHIAHSIQADKLIFITDQDGIYDKNGEIFSVLTKNQLEDLIDKKIVEGGMLTKVKAILQALNRDLSHVHILNGKKKHVLIEEFFTINGVGTLCQNDEIRVEVEHVSGCA
jgi:acetylglutamate kinase